MTYQAIKDLQVFEEKLYSLQSVKGKIIPYTDIPIDIGNHSIQSKILEFGGTSFFAHQNTLYYINKEDQQLYSVLPHTTPKLVLALPQIRLGDFCVGDDVVYCVMEKKDESSVLHTICAIDLKTFSIHQIHAKHDFYAYPRLSYDRKSLCWVAWDHPHMPWDETVLTVAKLETPFSCCNEHIIAKKKNVSFMEPLWLKDNRLVFFSDESGYWNPYVFDGKVHCIAKTDGDFSYPLWQLGIHRNVIFDEGNRSYLYSIVTKKCVDYLYKCNIETGELNALDLPYTSMHSLTANKEQLFLAGSSFKKPEELLSIVPNSFRVKKTVSYPKQFFSFSRKDGSEGYGWLYLPETKYPPLIIRCHGGPTAHASIKYNPEIEHWLKSGFAFLDLNYGGSTGFGKEYRELLNHNWGILDVNDVIDAAEALIEKDIVNEQQLFLKGSSAGGFTVLSALCKTGMFSAASCYYGISDLCALAEHTHKFEIHYLNKFIGPYPEAKPTYLERSPLSHAEKISTPTIFFQGDMDKVVLPSQTHDIYQSLKKRNIVTAYHLLKGEGHGIRQPENIKLCMEKELEFFKSKI